jgi:YVTN family beta-propeller protein
MAMLEVGQEIGGHRIDAVAGRGGMGVVYRATHLALNRTVALKLISPDLAEDAEFRARFKRESELAASLDHPNVVPIYHAGEDGGRLYVTMRFVDGTDLREMITLQQRLAPDLAARIISQVASALDAAHARGLVHRDVKPANVLIDNQNGHYHAYLTDFGLTKQVSSQSGLTKTGMMVGTVDYIAPEQLQGTTIDARADIYALGCVFYEALTGQVPFPRDSEPAKMWAHMGEPPPSPRSVAPDLPGPLDEVVTRAMAKEPDERYPSAGDLGRAALAGAEGELASRAERSVATGEAAPDTAAAPVPGATRIDTPGGGFAPPGPPPPGTPPGGLTAPGPVPGATVPPVAPPTQPPGWGPPPPGAQQPPGGGKSGGRRLLPFILAGAGLAALLLVVLVVVLVAGGGGGGGGGGGTSGPPQGVWVITGETSLTRLDPKTGNVTATIPSVGQKLVGVAAGQGAVWAADETGKAVVRIDTSTNKVVAKIPVSDTPNAVAVSDDGVFVSAGPSLIARIDPATNKIAASEDQNSSYDIAAGFGFVWGTNFLDNNVQRVVPGDMTLTEISQGVGKEPRFVSVGPDAVWVLASDGTLSRLEQSEGKQDLPKTTTTKASSGQYPGGMAADDQGVWIAESDSLWRHDPKTGALVQTISLGNSLVANGLAVGGGYVWVTDFSDGKVIRYDEKTKQVLPPIDISGDTSRLAVGPYGSDN